MKFLLTLSYLVVLGLFSFLGNRQQKYQLQQIGGRSGSTLRAYFLSLVMLVMIFLQFWILTGKFLFQLIILLIAASTLGTLIYVIIGAIAGFTLEEKKKKISALAVIWTVQNPIVGCAWLGTSLLITITTVIGNMWAFWGHPYGDPKALVWIAFFQFALPQIVVIPLSVISMWPVVTSEFLDDDLRNSYLASGFSNIFTRMIYLLFPIWLFKQEIAEVFRFELPSFWVLLSIPLILFIIGNVLPFFIGLYRFRSQARLMMAWREKWLREVLELVKLPEGKLRSKAMEEKLTQLQEEITARFAQNKLFHYYQDLISPNIESNMMPLPQLEAEAVPTLPQLADARDPLEDSPSLKISETLEVRKSIHTAKEFFTKKAPFREMGEELDENIYHIIKQNKANLVDWDVRFEHLYKLLQLFEIGLEGRTQDISGFIEARIEKISRAVAGLTSKRNLIAGTLLSIVSSTIVWAFKAYQSEIFELVGKLAQIQQ